MDACLLKSLKSLSEKKKKYLLSRVIVGDGTNTLTNKYGKFFFTEQWKHALHSVFAKLLWIRKVELSVAINGLSIDE